MSNKWEADAGNISDFKNFDSFVYRNGSVNEFLDNKGKSFVIAAKGLGKTLLLSYKRYLLENAYQQDGSLPLIFIPRDNPYLSFIKSVKSTLSREKISVLQDWEYCKRFWELVIELSILSYTTSEFKKEFKDFPQRVMRHKGFLEELIGQQNSIEYVFNEIILLNETVLTNFIDDVSNYIGKKFSEINQGVYIFMDRLDNVLETAHDQIWIPIQVGLLEAAWDLMRSNHHIKIFLSIRQEAYAAHHSRNTNAISSSVVKIEYSKTELKELVDNLVKFYENSLNLERFLGFDTFPNTITYMDENVFDFMYRYSIGRPRDFVQFCYELSKKKDSYHNISTKRMELKKSITFTSSNTIISSLYDELKMLMKCFMSLDYFNKFLVKLQHNVLTYQELKDICQDFNGENCNGECACCPSSNHPFCDLYNMGLLGIVERSSIDVEVKQKFKTPYEDFQYGLRGDIEFFLIHPALREYIKKLHNSSPIEKKYELYTGILVGAEVPWTNQYTELYKVNKFLDSIRVSDVFEYFSSLLKKYLKEPDFVFSQSRYDEHLKSYPLYLRKFFDQFVGFFYEGRIAMIKPITIFVSYAWENSDHQERVTSFVDMLRSMGFDAKMDTMLTQEYPDIDKLMTYGLRCDKIIIVLSPEYKRKADEASGGVWKEFKMIADDLEKNPQKYIFVSFEEFSEDLKEKISPKLIGNRWVVDLHKGRDDNYNELVAFIKEEQIYPIKKVNERVASVKHKTIKPF